LGRLQRHALPCCRPKLFWAFELVSNQLKARPFGRVPRFLRYRPCKTGSLLKKLFFAGCSKMPRCKLSFAESRSRGPSKSFVGAIHELPLLGQRRMRGIPRSAGQMGVFQQPDRHSDRAGYAFQMAMSPTLMSFFVTSTGPNFWARYPGFSINSV
jgi:hypothetical protein